MKKLIWLPLVIVVVAVALTAHLLHLCPLQRCFAPTSMAVIEEVPTTAPAVPPPITRRTPAIVKVALETREVEGALMEGVDKPTRYRFWTFNGTVPGPFIRVRAGDVLDLSLSNARDSIMPHNIDLHAVTGPGGGATITLAGPGQTRHARFLMRKPGLFVYHCAAPPVTEHLANGMYGLLLVEPPEGLPPVDHEYYVMQSEFYTTGRFGDEGLQAFAREKAEAAQPTYVVFNGKVGALTGDRALRARVGETVRLFVGNAGPNLTSSFHVIGTIFDRVYPEASLGRAETDVQTTTIPAGGASVVEFKLEVPGEYTMVDHSIFRLEKGALGQIKVEGEAAPGIYQSLP
jgi:nitrite reductase (NO-forming)